MPRETVCHKTAGVYAYLLDPYRLTITLKAKKGYLKTCQLLYGDPWEPKLPLERLHMNRVATDELFDYFSAILKVPTSRRLRYAFLLNDGFEEFWFTEAGFRMNPPEPEDMGRPYFQMLYIRENDTFSTPEWARQSVFYQIFAERFRNGDKTNDPTNVVKWGTLPLTSETFYGGDLKGIIDSLPYLLELGVNAVYLTPIFSSPSSHKYDTSDYYRIDQHFGDLDTFCELVRKCHEMEMKVVLDGVFDHCGFDFWAFQDVVEKGQSSKFKDWFRIYHFPVETHPSPSYETWGKQIWQMPRFMTSNPELKRYLLDVAIYWIKEADIDGWRLDTASEIDHEFWRDFRREVKKAKPQALIMGEISQNASPWLEGDQFDSAMNYPLRDIIVDFFAKGIINAEDFDARLARLRMQYYQQVNEVLYNLLGSHDTARFLSLCGQRQERMKLALIFQMTYVGMPAMYYGDEIGLSSGEKEEGSRSGMAWDKVQQNLELFEFCKNLIRLRKNHKALTHGNFVTLCSNSKTNVYSYLRTWEKDSVVVVLNNSLRKHTTSIGVGDISPSLEVAFNSASTAQEYTASRGMMRLCMQPLAGLIFSASELPTNTRT